MDYTGSPPQTQRPQPGPYIASYPPEAIKTDFQRKYPPDPFGEEMEAGARVWKVFKEEATSHDKTLLVKWNKTLDILLIFAGLFSAVATAFVIESYKLLQPDYEEYIATALFVAFSSRNTSGALPVSTLDLQNPADFAPLHSSRWLNGIWFTSLVLSLLVAFLCILIKQWLEEYNGRISAPFASARQWARRRTFYFEGMTDWAVPTCIALLPLLLHAALFLFLAGLGVFLLPLDSVNAVWLLALTGCLAVFYTVSTALPFIRPDCPSSTPIIRLFRPRLTLISLRVLMALSSVVVSRPRAVNRVVHGNDGNSTRALSVTQRVLQKIQHLLLVLYQSVSAMLLICVGAIVPSGLKMRMMETYWRLHHRFSATTTSSVGDPSLHGRDFSDSEQDNLEAHALRWLITSRSTAESVLVGFQALSALPPWSPVVRTVRGIDDVKGLLARSLHAVYRSGNNVDWCTPADMARSFRSAMCLFDSFAASLLIGGAARGRFDTALRTSPHYDLPFLHDFLGVYTRGNRLGFSACLEMCLPTSPHADCRPHFLLSTAFQALHDDAIPLPLWLQLCNMLPFLEVFPCDFIPMTMALLRFQEGETCALSPLHRGRACNIQCSFELLSGVINSREDLELSVRDARIGLSIMLHYCRMQISRTTDIWVPLEQSHLFALIRSELFKSHDMPFFWFSIQALVGMLRDTARSLQKSVGLPPWTSEWGQAIQSILTVVSKSPNRDDVPYKDIAFRIAVIIVEMFSVQGPARHVWFLSTDDVTRLPLILLRGGSTSAWEMLISLPQYDFAGIHLDRLGNLLASCLCIAARQGIDISAELDTFITSSHLVQRLHKLQRISDRTAHAMVDFVTLARHCNEIQPNWLPRVLAKALALGTGDSAYDTSLRHTVDYVVATAARLRECELCPSGPRSRFLGIYRRLTSHPSVKTYDEARADWLGSYPARDDYDRGADLP